tara:strand:+ start:224 stop:652 length:429 start_codon:yes stop_codon:yes gene_type:complete
VSFQYPASQSTTSLLSTAEQVIAVPAAAFSTGVHASQSAVEAALKVPAGHALQVVAAVETAPLPATASATLPAAHVLQAEASVSSLYSPAPHAVQPPPSVAQPWPSEQLTQWVDPVFPVLSFPFKIVRPLQDEQAFAPVPAE